MPSSTVNLIICNAAAMTFDEAQPNAEAVALSGDRILSVGSNKSIRALAGPTAEKSMRTV